MLLNLLKFQKITSLTAQKQFKGLTCKRKCGKYNFCLNFNSILLNYFQPPMMIRFKTMSSCFKIQKYQMTKILIQITIVLKVQKSKKKIKKPSNLLNRVRQNQTKIIQTQNKIMHQLLTFKSSLLKLNQESKLMSGFGMKFTSF